MFTRSADPRFILLVAAGFVMLALPGMAQAQGYPGTFDFGQPASAQDIAAVAIAIAPDGQGLPPGKGDYAAGKVVYENACSACHGKDLKGSQG
jgi:cytochrome c